MEPQLDTRGKPQLDDARHPRAEDTYLGKGQWGLTLPPTVGPWDVDADDALADAAPANPLLPPPAPAPPAPAPAAPDPATPARRITAQERRRRKLTQVALALRSEGLSVNDIATRLSVAASTVTGWFTRHRRDVATEDLDALLDKAAVPLAVENLMHGLLAGDKQYTLETLKGRGAFRRHTEGDGKVATELPALSITFVAAGDRVARTERVGTVVGTPRQVEGQVIDAVQERETAALPGDAQAGGSEDIGGAPPRPALVRVGVPAGS